MQEVDLQRHLIFVRSVDGKMEISWPGDSGEIHTRILERMRGVLLEDTDYPYLTPNARERLKTARRIAARAGMGESMLISLGGSSVALFPWLGTRAFRTLRRYLTHNAARLGIADVSAEGCCYMTFKTRGESPLTFFEAISSDFLIHGLDAEALVSENECPVYEKYDEYIPAELLREAYAADRLEAREVLWRFGGEEGGRFDE